MKKQLGTGGEYNFEHLLTKLLTDEDDLKIVKFNLTKFTYLCHFFANATALSSLRKILCALRRDLLWCTRSCR